MLDQLEFLGKKSEIALAKTYFGGHLAGTSWKYKSAVDGLIRTGVLIFFMAVAVFFPLVTNYAVHNVFDPYLATERTLFSIMLIVAGAIFNKIRILALVLALIPIGLILLSYLYYGHFNTRIIGFLGAMFFLIAAGFYYNYKEQKLRKALELGGE